MGFAKKGLDCQGEPWKKLCSGEMKVYKLEKNESERDVRVTAGGAVYRSGVEGPSLPQVSPDSGYF